MDNIKYTIETLDDINIHEGLTKEQIDSFEKKEKDCLDAFKAIPSLGDDFNTSHRDVAETSILDRLGELIDTLIKTGALNWAIKLCVIKVQYISNSYIYRKGHQFAGIIDRLTTLKQPGLAEEVVKIALKNISETAISGSKWSAYHILGVFTGSPKRLNNKKLALEIFQKAEIEAEDFFEFNELACSIADDDYLGDKNYAKKVFQKAENLAAVEKTNTQYESFKRFLALGQSYIYYLDKNSARIALEKAENLAQNWRDRKDLAEIVAFDLEDPVWEKKLLEKKKSK
ncbi:hypothetical protein OAM52_04840 [Flavobacteriaceae bacterium]|nr:hypothetical protein [Flavobacteriaceae bacterium]